MPVAAAIGRGQLTAIDDRVARRRAIFDRYVKRLGSLPGIAFMPEPARRRPLWKPMHLQPAFAACPAHVSGVSEALFARGLCLPSGPAMSAEDLERVIGCVPPLARGR